MLLVGVLSGVLEVGRKQDHVEVLYLAMIHSTTEIRSTGVIELIKFVTVTGPNSLNIFINFNLFPMFCGPGISSLTESSFKS